MKVDIGLDELLDDMRKMYEEILIRLSRIEDAQKLCKTITVKEIAGIEGVSMSLIKTNARYLLPRFGESAYPDGLRRWDLDEYFAWRRIPSSERKKMLEEHREQEEAAKAALA